MSKKLLFKGGLATGMRPYEIEDFSTLYMRDARVDEKTKAYIDSVIGNSVLNLCPYRNVLVTHKYDTVEGNVITLDDCQDDEVIQLSEIQGNTLVNCCKDGSKELTLNGDIDTSGYNNVTLTEGVDGGKVDVALEGNTMVNVCDQEEPVAITKSYEVTTGNHIALQGEYDGKCRPNIYGNTLVNLNTNKLFYSDSSKHDYCLTYTPKKNTLYTVILDLNYTTTKDTNIWCGFLNGELNAWKGQIFNLLTGMSIYTVTTEDSDDLGDKFRIGWNDTYISDVTVNSLIILEGDYTNKPIPEYFTGMQSSFEDKLITDEKDAHNGKYKVDYKVTGKNKWNGAGNTMDKYTLGLFQKSYQGRYIKVGKPNTNYVLSVTDPIIPSGHWVVINAINPTTGALSQLMNICKTGQNSNNDVRNIVVSSDSNGFVRLSIYIYRYTEEHWKVVQNLKFQIEEGDTATTYEPYKEYTKTLYLNSPLLEGDTIEQSGNDIVHVHKYNKVVFDGSDDELWYLHNNAGINCNEFRCTRINNKNLPLMVNSNANSLCDKYITQSSGDIERFAWGGGAIYLSILKTKIGYDLNELRKYLNSNPITCMGELATPTREVISTNDNLILDSYVNGHLDVDSVVPIDKVAFKSYGKFLKYLYPSIEYTIQFESDNKGILNALALNDYDTLANLNIVKGINKFTITTGDKINSSYLWTDGIGFNMSKVVVTPKVDGDFGYFKGMKSVGQNDVDGNKIEILSSKYKANHLNNSQCVYFNPNNTGLGLSTLMTDESERYYRAIADEGRNVSLYGRPSHDYSYGEEYIYSMMIRTQKDTRVTIYENNHEDETKNTISVKANEWTTISTKPTKLFNLNALVLIADEVNCYVDYKNVKLEKGKTVTPWMPSKNDNEYNLWRFLNKKEILMNEPLRGLPNGTKDKYVIIDGKWYIERNCGYVTFDGSDDENWIGDNQYGYNGDTSDCVGFKIEVPNIIESSTGYGAEIIGNAIISNNLKVADLYGKKVDGINWGWGKFIFIKCSSSIEPNDFKSKLSVQPLKVIYQLATPTYEPIDYNPFEVYSDITHISNNSTIPCNMVIKNSGYNTIIKPSTLYTVALDTNKNGTIGLNLGGTKVTITNNVTTITTPATLTDNSLILYGKGIKASRVRLLEGDKTNWIPSHFEGMKSCFEDKLQDDGKYKMEILCNNKNLFDYNSVVKRTINSQIEVGENYITITDDYYCGNIMKVKPFTNYYIQADRDIIGDGNGGYIAVYKTDGKIVGGTTALKPGTGSDGYFNSGANNYVSILFYGGLGKRDTCKFSNVQIREGTTETEYVPRRINKIQFLLNEPLRGIGDIKDKIYVKEDKIVVERNCGKYTLKGTEGWYHYSVSTTHYECGCDVLRNTLIKRKSGIYADIISDKFSTIKYNGNPDIIASIPISLASNVNEFKQWLQQNPTTVVYQLQTPVYEEVECDLSKLALEGYDHGTLFYDTNIPVTTQFYEFNVNIKDMLIPNETYYVTFTADRIKDITINLSGVQVNYKTSMGYNKVPIQLGDIVNTNFSMDSRGVEISDLMVSTSTSLIHVKDMNDVCVYDEATNKYSITITSTNGKESDKRVILLDYPLLRLNKDIYDRLYYSNKDSKYKIDKKVFKHKFTNNHEYNKYAAETNDTYYSSFISLNEAIKDYVVITNEKVKTIKVEDDKYYFKIKWSDLGVSDKTEANGNQGVKDFFNNNEVYLYYATDGFVEIVDGLTRQTLKVYQPETTMKFLGNTTTTVTILIPMKNV